MSVVTSDTGKNGTFTSANYPSYYPTRTHCRYDFIGTARQRVQIVFTDFNLYHPDGAHTGERGKGQGPLSPREEEKRKQLENE